MVFDKSAKGNIGVRNRSYLNVYDASGLKIAKVKGVSWRLFHGDADDIVPVECSRRAYKVLKEAGADVEYIEFPGCNHGSWNPAFNYPGFMDWLFKQKR